MTVTVRLVVEAPNEFNARHVATDCWALHRVHGFSKLGSFDAAPGPATVEDVAEEAERAPQAAPPSPRIPSPPPERRYSRPPREPELEIW